MAEKRKTYTSWQVKSRYNQKVYRAVTVRIKHSVAERLDAYCAATGCSRAQFIENALDLLEKNSEERAETP